MKGFKGFDKDLKCRDQQYVVGETIMFNGEPLLCSAGLHFVEHPLDALSYYKPNDGSRYAEIEADGVTDQKKEDSKRVATSLTVRAEIKIPSLVRAAVQFVFDQVKPSTGNYAHSATTGNSAHSSVKGHGVIAASLGREGQAKAPKGSWLILAEYRNGEPHVKSVGVAWVDGEKIKANTFYTLKNGQFAEAEK